MNSELKHLILFDDQCPFCQRCIRFILSKDRKSLFCFASLHGETAKSFEGQLDKNDKESIVYIQNFKTSHPQIHYRFKAVFNIAWDLGGFYKLFGWKKILPAFLFDWLYVLIAKNRKRLCSTKIPYKQGARKGVFLP